jgi:hypothetical protein
VVAGLDSPGYRNPFHAWAHKGAYTLKAFPAIPRGAQGIVLLLTRAIVIGPAARLELISVEGNKQTHNLSANPLG